MVRWKAGIARALAAEPIFVRAPIFASRRADAEMPAAPLLRCVEGRCAQILAPPARYAQVNLATFTCAAQLYAGWRRRAGKLLGWHDLPNSVYVTIAGSVCSPRPRAPPRAQSRGALDRRTHGGGNRTDATIWPPQSAPERPLVNGLQGNPPCLHGVDTLAICDPRNLPPNAAQWALTCFSPQAGIVPGAPIASLGGRRLMTRRIVADAVNVSRTVVSTDLLRRPCGAAHSGRGLTAVAPAAVAPGAVPTLVADPGAGWVLTVVAAGVGEARRSAVAPGFGRRRARRLRGRPPQLHHEYPLQHESRGRPKKPTHPELAI
jgi:hypothetical protein